MDLDPRHDLAENDLLEFLSRFGPWWKKHGNTITFILLAAALLYFGRQYYLKSQAASHESAWHDLAGASSPAAYLNVAETHDSPSVQALAYLRGADALLQEAELAHDTSSTPLSSQSSSQQTPENPEIDPAVNPGKSEPEKNNPSIGPEIGASRLTRQQALDQASVIYEKVAHHQDYHPIYRLNALLGLATVAENQQNWPAAKQHYHDALSQSQGKYETIHSIAQARLDWLDKLAKPVHFASPPPPEQSTANTPPPPTTQPSAQPESSTP